MRWHFVTDPVYYLTLDCFLFPCTWHLDLSTDGIRNKENLTCLCVAQSLCAGDFIYTLVKVNYSIYILLWNEIFKWKQKYSLKFNRRYPSELTVPTSWPAVTCIPIAVTNRALSVKGFAKDHHKQTWFFFLQFELMDAEENSEMGKGKCGEWM